MTPSSTTAPESVATSTVPVSFSRETLAALKDCQWEAFEMVSVLEPNGEVDALFSESNYYSEIFWTEFEVFLDACRQAAAALDVDSLQLGAS